MQVEREVVLMKKAILIILAVAFVCTVYCAKQKLVDGESVVYFDERFSVQKWIDNFFKLALLPKMTTFESFCVAMFAKQTRANRAGAFASFLQKATADPTRVVLVALRRGRKLPEPSKRHEGVNFHRR